jgi:hypothetical protein
MSGQTEGSDYDEHAANLNNSPYLIEFPKEIEKKIPHLLGFLDLNQLETNHSIPLEKGGLLHLFPIESLSEKERKSPEKHVSPMLDNYEVASTSKAPIRNISVKYNTAIGLVNHLNTYPNSNHHQTSPDHIYTQNLTSAIDKTRNDSFAFSATLSMLPSTTIPLSANLPRTSVSNSITNAESIADSSTRPSASSRLMAFTVSMRNSLSNGNHAVKLSNQSTAKHRELDRKNTFSSLASFRVPMTAISTQTTQSTPLLLKLVSSDSETVEDITNEKLYVHIDPNDALAAIESYVPSRWDEIRVSLYDRIRPIHKFNDGIFNRWMYLFEYFRMDLCT